VSIFRNSAWNMIGIVVSTLFTIPSLAVYSRYLGVERLGLLTLTFSIVGYASSFDLGLSRALIRQVSINVNDKGAVKEFMGTTAIFVAILSLAVGMVTWAASGWLTSYLKVSSANWMDSTNSFHWLSLSIPPYLLSLVAAAYYEGIEDFRTLSIIRIITGGFNAIAGVACVFWVPTLSAVVAALCVSRWMLCIAVFAMYRRDINAADEIARPAMLTFNSRALRASLTYGGWLTITNIITPVMGFLDRFVLSHLAGAQIVAFYTVPSEVINRLLLIPGAISRTLFPRLSKPQHTATGDRRIGMMLTLAATLLTIIPVFIFAREILRVWMGPAYVGEPVTVLRILLIGFFFMSIAFGPFTDLQARGHSRATAFIHLGQVVPYLAALALMTYYYGILGTALVWTARTIVDYFLMQYYCRRMSGMRL
jgi:O-antigen/teichoic acid export membrane protein